MIWLQTTWQAPALDWLDGSQGMFDLGQKTKCQKSQDRTFSQEIPDELRPERNGCPVTEWSPRWYSAFAAFCLGPLSKSPSDNNLAICSDGLLGWCPKCLLSCIGGWELGLQKEISNLFCAVWFSYTVDAPFPCLIGKLTSHQEPDRDSIQGKNVGNSVTWVTWTPLEWQRQLLTQSQIIFWT